MPDQARGVGAFCEAVLRQVIDKTYLGEFAGLGETTHRFADLEIDVPVGDVRVEVVAVQDGGRSHAQGGAEIFVSRGG